MLYKICFLRYVSLDMLDNYAMFHKIYALGVWKQFISFNDFGLFCIP